MDYKKIMILTIINDIKIFVSVVFLPFVMVSLVLLGILYFISIVFDIKSIINFVENRKQRQWVEKCMVAICLVVGISIVSLSFWNTYKTNNQNKSDIDAFLISTKDNKIKDSEDTIELSNNNDDVIAFEPIREINSNYLAVIEITKINLLQGIIKSNSYDSAIDKNVSFLTNTNLPNVDGGNFTLAAHSGNANISYFNNINSLKVGDKITIYYNSIKYTYSVYKNYVVSGEDMRVLNKEDNKTIITLVTCKKDDNKKRVIIKAELIKEEQY